MPKPLSRIPRAAAAVLLAIGACSLLASAQSDHSQDVARVKRATEIFRTVMKGPGRAIPQKILKTGQCVMIIPGYKTLAFGIGGAYGKGIAMCRNKPAELPETAPGAPLPAPGASKGWSAPIFVSLGGVSLGPQIGVDSADLVLVFQSRAGLESMLNNKVRLGVSASAAAGPVGRRVEAATDAAMRAQVVAYARSRGLFAGVNINGAIVQPDESGNRTMYPHQYWQDILDGKVRPRQRDVEALVGELDTSPYTNPAIRTPANAATAPAGRLGQAINNMGPGPAPPLPYQIGIAWQHVTGDIGMGGWDLRGGVRPLPRRLDGLSLIADISRGSGSTSVLATSLKSTQWTFLFGPEFDAPHRLLDPYGNVLFGYAHLSQQTSSLNASSSAGFSTFAWQLGGGIKLNVSKWISVRLIEIDLLHTSFGSDGGSHARFSIGGEFNF